MNTNKLDALAASDIEVTNSNNIVTIGNEYIEREFSTVDNKLKTTSIENKRAKTTFEPATGSEEFIIKTTKEQKDAPVVPALNRNDGLWKLSAVAGTEKNFLFNPYLDFTRKRKLSFNELIKFIICMKSGAIEDKLYKYFKN